VFRVRWTRRSGIRAAVQQPARDPARGLAGVARSTAPLRRSISRSAPREQARCPRRRLSERPVSPPAREERPAAASQASVRRPHPSRGRRVESMPPVQRRASTCPQTVADCRVGQRRSRPSTSTRHVPQSCHRQPSALYVTPRPCSDGISRGRALREPDEAWHPVYTRPDAHVTLVRRARAGAIERPTKRILSQQLDVPD
jgi:hypothetical protein